MFAEKKTEKSDNLVLIDVINNKEIAETECIEANTHVIVMRTPQKADVIELTYNPKLTGENTLGQVKSEGAALAEGLEEDTEEKDEEKEIGEEKVEEGEVIRFQTSKIE